MANGGWRFRTGARGRQGCAGVALIALALLAGVLARPTTASAQIPDTGGDTDPPGEDLALYCLTEARGSIWASPDSLIVGQTTTLTWSVQAPSGCSALAVTVHGLSEGRSGSRTVSGIDNSSSVHPPVSEQPELLPHLRTKYSLRVTFAGARRTLADVDVTVYLPMGVDGRYAVTITENHQVPLLVLAARVPYTRVFVQNHVALDVSGWPTIYVAEGVELLGGRTAREPGGLIYMAPPPFECSGFPPTCGPRFVLFMLADGRGPGDGDNVRISGLRISGGEMGVAWGASPVAHAIVIDSRVNVEISNNEIFGWRGSAVTVRDSLHSLDRIHYSGPNPTHTTVRIRHNYIHHNQHAGRDGYGVAVYDGAYALIEKNVFDYNRHAIASGGEEYTGYVALRNLVLENGGYHTTVGPVTDYTHQFDMHGTESCGLGHLNCGSAGEFMEISYNSFFYTKSFAFKLRGTPHLRALVKSNVFAHDLLYGPVDGALGGYFEHMHMEDNLTGINESGNYGRCDFDADGIADLFLATGQTWWFNSGGNRHWRYLNTSTKRLHELSLGDVDGDRRCDVVVDGVVVSGGTGMPTRHPASIVWQQGNGQVAVWKMSGATVEAATQPGVMPSLWQVAGLGDFSGDGHQDILWRNEYGEVAVWDMANGYKLAETYGTPVSGSWLVQGLGDFDGNGVADGLWRNSTGQLAIWFNGAYPGAVAAATPHAVAYLGYRNVPEAVDPTWSVIGIGDFDGDGRADILWRHPQGKLTIWHMTGGLRTGETIPAASAPPASMRLAGVADFDADGRSDLLWRDSLGAMQLWFGGDPGRVAHPAYRNMPGPMDPEWQVAKTADFNRDGRADILWRDPLGRFVIWFMAGGRFLREAYLPIVDASWQLAGSGLERPRTTNEEPVVEPELELEPPVRRRLP